MTFTLIQTLMAGFKRNTTAWIETLILGGFGAFLWIEIDGLVLGYPQHHFFWPVVAPLLVSLRYGFAKGFLCALLTIVVPFLWISYYQPGGEYSISFAVGTILITMIAGEFRDYWDEILQKKALEHENMARKLDSFSQNYYLLRASHDQLEQKVAGQVVSLRFSVSELHKIAAKNPSPNLSGLGKPILSLFSDIIGIEVAGLYSIYHDQIEDNAIATLGDMTELDRTDPMLKDTLEHKVVFSPVKLEAGEEHRSKYQLCVPILNSHRELLAVVAVERTKFFMLSQQNIALLALVSNCISDFLETGQVTPLLSKEEGSTFVLHVQRAVWNKQLYNADSTLLVCSGMKEKALALYQRTINQRRGADVYWQCESPEGEELLAILLPMVSLYEAEQFVNRLKQQYQQLANTSESELMFLGPVAISNNAENLTRILNKLGVGNEVLADYSNFHL